MGCIRGGGWLCFLAVAASLSAAPPAPVIEPRGPGHFPQQLSGTWKVGLCCRPFHAWIRYENVNNGEVHTLARFMKNSGNQADPYDGTQLPPVTRDGLWWDQDLRHEGSLRKGHYLLLSVIVKDPLVFTSYDKGECYHVLRNNCTTFAAEAWHFYSGEWYPVPRLGLPRRFANEIHKRHPAIPVKDLLGKN